MKNFIKTFEKLIDYKTAHLTGTQSLMIRHKRIREFVEDGYALSWLDPKDLRDASSWCDYRSLDDFRDLFFEASQYQNLTEGVVTKDDLIFEGKRRLEYAINKDDLIYSFGVVTATKLLTDSNITWFSVQRYISQYKMQSFRNLDSMVSLIYANTNPSWNYI